MMPLSSMSVGSAVVAELHWISKSPEDGRNEAVVRALGLLRGDGEQAVDAGLLQRWRMDAGQTTPGGLCGRLSECCAILGCGCERRSGEGDLVGLGPVRGDIGRVGLQRRAVAFLVGVLVRGGASPAEAARTSVNSHVPTGTRGQACARSGDSCVSGCGRCRFPCRIEQRDGSSASTC